MSRPSAIRPGNSRNARWDAIMLHERVGMPRLVKQHSPFLSTNFAADIFPFEDHFQIALVDTKRTSRWDASGTSASSKQHQHGDVMPPVPVRDKLHPIQQMPLQRFRHSLTQGAFPSPLGPSMVITGAIAVIFISLNRRTVNITARIIRADATNRYVVCKNQFCLYSDGDLLRNYTGWQKTSPKDDNDLLTRGDTSRMCCARSVDGG